jgi:hypothetical protein
MARFVTRVELHAAADVDYANLHQSMEQEGFSRTIKSGDGTVYQLPTATYYWETDKDRNAVLEAAKAAASKTNKTFGVIVTESQVSTWHGLPFASEPKAVS